MEINPKMMTYFPKMETEVIWMCKAKFTTKQTKWEADLGDLTGSQLDAYSSVERVH